MMAGGKRSRGPVGKHYNTCLTDFESGLESVSESINDLLIIKMIHRAASYIRLNIRFSVSLVFSLLLTFCHHQSVHVNKLSFGEKLPVFDSIVCVLLGINFCGVAYKVCKSCPRLLQRLLKILKVWRSGKLAER